jgi:hypothetical protein
MAKLRANMVVLGDSPEAARIRAILLDIGATVVDASDAYKLDSYAAVFVSDKPLTQTLRSGKIRSMRFCKVRRTVDELMEAGVDHIPTCVANAQGVVVFSRSKIASGHHMSLENAIQEIERVCTRFRNFAIDKAFQDAASERKKRARQARAVA